MFTRLNMTCDKTLIYVFYAWLTEESYLILYNYIKWWSFIEIVEIEMESEWIDEWKIDDVWYELCDV